MTEVKIWGCRGSLPTPGKSFVKYGGNTACVQITGDDGTVLILDAGTGIRELGETLNPTGQPHNLLLTHMHLDHVQGMGFFSPFFDPESIVNLWGPAITTLSLRSRLTRYMSPPLFPVTLRDFPCELNLYQVPTEPFTIGPFRVCSSLVAHSGPTVGYRIECEDGVITYLPDHEPSLGMKVLPKDTSWTSGHGLAKEADLLIHDTQYQLSEYEEYRGWGHSSLQDALQFATRARVKKLVAFHHDPAHTDQDLDQMFSNIASQQSLPFEFTTAREGAVYTLSGN